MHSHIAFELLKTLSHDELKRFDDFVRSPFFNKREAVVRLFDLISKHAPDFTHSSLKKENLYKKLFPGKPYNEQTLRSRMSELSSLIKEFLIEAKFSEDAFIQKKYYIQELLKRKKFELCEKQIKEGLENIDKDEKFDQDRLMDKLKLLEEYTKLLNIKDLKPESIKLSYEISEIIIVYFLVDFLKTNSNIICDEIETKQKGDSSILREFFSRFDMEGFLNFLKEKYFHHYPVLALNYYADRSMLKPEEEHYFYEMKSLIYKYHNQFSLDELYNYWTILSNSVLINYRAKGDKFLKEGHEINKFFIEKKLYDDTKPFSPLGYQNIMTNALMVYDLDWAEKFIDEFKDKLPPEVVNNRYNYCKAVINFERKKYNDSIEYLSRVDPIDWSLKINVRLYYFQNYYELGMSEQVISLIDSFRHFSSNNPDIAPEYMDEKVKNTIKYISKMSRAKFGGKKLDYADFKEAESTKNYLYRKWILEKMKELI